MSAAAAHFTEPLVARHVATAAPSEPAQPPSVGASAILASAQSGSTPQMPASQAQPLASAAAAQAAALRFERHAASSASARRWLCAMGLGTGDAPQLARM